MATGELSLGSREDLPVAMRRSRSSNSATNSSLLCILYCEFDPHRGPRPVFQVPKNYVSAEVCEILSDHLIASSELCGHLIGVAAFGLQFVGHPEYIRDERYERNQFMYNVCFVFDAQTDVSAFRPLISKVARDFRRIEAEHRFLSCPDTRGRIQDIIGGILCDIKQTGVLDVPLSPESVDTGLDLQPYDALLEAVPQVQPHEVPVWVAATQSSNTHKICSEYQHSHPFITQLLPFFTEDGRAGGSDVATIVRRTSLELPQVLSIVALLVQRDIIRLVDRVHMSNVYVCTNQLRHLPRDQRLRKQCVDYCRSTGAAAAPSFSAAYRILCAIDPSKRLSEVCQSLPRSCGAGVAGGAGAGGGRQDAVTGNIDVMRLVRFACVHRFIRRMHHWPIWLGAHTGPGGGAGAGAGGLLRRAADASSGNASKSKTCTAPVDDALAPKARSGSIRELSDKMLPLCNGRNCYDAMACALGVTVEEVEHECERGPHKEEIVVIARMSCDAEG